MQSSALFKPRLLAAGIFAALGFGLQPAAAGYIQSNLVSDITGLAALTDPALKNPWGISWGLAQPTPTPFWVSDQKTGVTTLYRVAGGSIVKANEISISPPANGQGPTGQVSNIGGSNFVISGGAARFIFANLNGTISAWNQTLGTNAAVQVTTPGAVYTGLAISSGKDRLYAANVLGGTIDVFNGSFAQIALGGNAFQNPFPGLVPFNVQEIGGKIYVTYAVPGLTKMQNAAEGSGAVAVFDENGALQQKLIEGSKLASPWGLALPRPLSASSAAICWLAISASPLAKLMHSIH